MGQIIDAKPKNEVVLDYKPKVEIKGALAYQSYFSTIEKGMPMGLLLVLTYPETITFQTPIHF